MEKYRVDATVTVNVSAVVLVENFDELQQALIDHCNDQLTWAASASYNGTEDQVEEAIKADLTNWDLLS